MKENFAFLQNIKLHTPIQLLMPYRGSSIYIKRDDRISYAYGGNKVRIAIELFKDMEKKGCDAIITYGSRESNLNRVIAMMARESGVVCVVVTSLSEEEWQEYENGGRIFSNIYQNEKILLETGAKRVLCKKDAVAKTIEEIIADLSHAGYTPYYVYGDVTGKGHEEVIQRAYQICYEEIDAHMKEEQMCFDAIVLAYGTGMSFLGLKQGRGDMASPLLCGISIAREIDVEDEGSCITSSYIQGGYGKYSKEVFTLSKEIYEKYHIALDPIYTAKAWYGMLEEIRSGRLQGNILFIHTGGYPIFMDMLSKEDMGNEN